MQATLLTRCAASVCSTTKGVERSVRMHDVTLRVVSVGGAVRVVYASTLGLLRETVRRHQLALRTQGHRQFMELLGTHLSFTNLLAALQEGEERVASRFTADEATVVTEALALGECRCNVRGDHNATIDGPLFPLRVDRILYGQNQPFSSVTAACVDQLVYGDEEEKGEGNEISRERLWLKGVPRKDLENFFRYNISLHGYNFFRQSEGSAAALLCCAHLDDPSIEEGLACHVEDALASNPENTRSAENKLDTALGHAGLSCGVLVQPLLAGQAVERHVHKLQEALVRAFIADKDGIFGEVFYRAKVDGLACQDLISLVTGDYEGAYAVATAARQFVQDPSVTAPIFEKLRRRLGISEFLLPLDSATVMRNRLDYFCRCSKESFLQSVITLPKEELVRVMQETSFSCTFCAKEYRLQPEDWQRALQGRDI